MIVSLVCLLITAGAFVWMIRFYRRLDREIKQLNDAIEGKNAKRNPTYHL